jgi:hypothetical protein
LVVGVFEISGEHEQVLQLGEGSLGNVERAREVLCVLAS